MTPGKARLPSQSEHVLAEERIYLVPFGSRSPPPIWNDPAQTPHLRLGCMPVTLVQVANSVAECEWNLQERNLSSPFEAAIMRNCNGRMISPA